MGLLTLAILAVLVAPAFAARTASRQQRWLRVAAILFFVCSLGTLWWATLEADQSSGASSSWIFCSSLMIIGAAVSLAIFIRFRSWVVPGAGVCFVAAMLGLHFFDLSPVKPFNRFQTRVQKGMTLEEVRAALAREFPEAGRFPAPVPEQGLAAGRGPMAFYMDRGMLLVLFENGRIAEDPIRTTASNLYRLMTAIPSIWALVALLLCLKEWLRVRYGVGEEPAGHGIDVGPVVACVQRVRREFYGGYLASHHQTCRRRALLASARHALGYFSHFRNRDGRGVPVRDDEPGNQG